MYQLSEIKSVLTYNKAGACTPLQGKEHVKQLPWTVTKLFLAKPLCLQHQINVNGQQSELTCAT